MFFALQLDRGNITQALSDNMLGILSFVIIRDCIFHNGILTEFFVADLKMTTNDYNNGMTIFYCSFLFAELPSQLISKKVGPDNWIPYVFASSFTPSLVNFWGAVQYSNGALEYRCNLPNEDHWPYDILHHSVLARASRRVSKLHQKLVHRAVMLIIFPIEDLFLMYGHYARSRVIGPANASRSYSI